MSKSQAAVRVNKYIKQIVEAQRRGDPRASPDNISKGLALAARRNKRREKEKQ